MIDFSPATIDKILDYVDCPAPKTHSKRRDAYLTEWYFENTILQQIAQGSVSTGWCYVENYGIRHWFKTTDNFNATDPQRDTDKQIITVLKKADPGQRFFTIFEARGNIHLREIIENRNEWTQTLPKDAQNICNITAINANLAKLSQSQKHISPYTKTWLCKADSIYRKNLLLQRLLMNIGLGEQYPLDIDAIELENNQLIFHEFKRKTKCPDGCFIIKNKAMTKQVLLDILKKCKASKLTYGEELFDFIETRLQYQRDDNAQCYGLDMSHVSNYEFCQTHNIRYKHTIWDSSDYPDKPQIDDLFNNHIKPKNGIHLKSATITPNSFMGFIFTGGTNSGTFHNRLRIQATLKAGSFE